MQGAAVGQKDLAADDVDPRHHFGHGVFDLDARIDLDEIEAAGVDVDEEFHRPGRAIAHFPADRHGGVADLLAQVLGKPRAGRNLDDLLMAALHRAIALPEVHQVPVHVAEDLHFDVLGSREIALEEDVGLAEGRRGFAPGLGNFGVKVFGPVDRPDSAAAAAEARLDHQRVADLLCRGGDVVVLTKRGFGTGNGGHSNGVGQAPRGSLVAERVELVGGRADEGHPGGVARAREARILGEESVAGMEGVGAALLRDGDDLIDVQIGADRLAAPGGTDGIGFVRLEPMRREAILVAVDGNRPQAKLCRRAETADGDLRPVRNQKLVHR